MKGHKFFPALLLLFFIIAAVNLGEVYAVSDLTLTGAPVQPPGNTSINPASNAQVVGILDDFNRPDGPIGGNWTIREGAFNVVNNAAQGGPAALATYNGASSNIVEADVEVTGTALQYVGLVLSYLDMNNNLFLKVQQQDGGGTFDHAACYISNNGGSFGLGFFPLSSPFSTAHMKAELSGNTVTLTFSNIDGGSGTQTYICNDAPTTGGNGIGINGFDIAAGRIDNFAAATGQTTTVPTMTEWGMMIFMVLAGSGAVYYLRRQKKTER